MSKQTAVLAKVDELTRRHGVGYLAEEIKREFSALWGKAEEEETHAKKFYQFLTDRGSVPVIGPFKVPANAYDSLLAVAHLLHAHERENTRLIHALYETAGAEKDYATQVFLHFFISEQVEEESWTDKLLTKVKQSTCGGALFNLDRHISKELVSDE